MNNHLASETTPLLPVQQHSDDLDAVPVTPVVHSIDTTDLAHIRWEDLTPQPIPASLELDQCKRLAFALIVLLQLRRQRITRNNKIPDVYEQWTEDKVRLKDIEVLEEKVSELWENFLAQYHGPRELYDVLWSPFPLVLGKTATIRAVDFLAVRDAPQKLVSHPIVSMTLTRAWRLGRPKSNVLQTWLSNCFNTSATPYKTHLLELLFDFGTLFFLLSYVMRPPNWPHSSDQERNPTKSYPYTAREVYLVTHALSILLSAQGVIVITAVLTLLAFTLALPSLPLPGSLSFSILLWVILLRFLMYHNSSTLPGPLLLFSHHRSFPIATFLGKGLIRIIRPLFSFYLPIALVAFLALSISLSGPLTGPINYLHTLRTSWIPSRPDPPIIGVAPMDTRVVFFLFSVAVMLFVFSSAYIIGTSTPIAHPHHVISFPSLMWDFYSPEIGYEARVASYRASVIYSMDYPFPPPFNLIELLLVTIPISFVRFLGHRHVRRRTMARYIWNITVRPFMIIVAVPCALLA